MRGQPVSLNTLHDVNPASIADGVSPVWDSATKKFKMGVPGTALAGAHDRFVAAATPVSTYALSYLPSWINALAKNGDMLAEGYDYTVNYTSGVITLATVPTAGDVIAVSYVTNGSLLALPSGGLLAWWRADTIGQADGTAVSTWTDFTANHWTATQSSAPSRPTYRAAPTGFNGQPALQFSGGQELDLPYNAAFNLTGTSKLTVAIVMNHPNDGNTGFLLGMRDTSGGGSSGQGWIITKTFLNQISGFGQIAGVASSPPSMWAVFDLDNAAPLAHSYLSGAAGSSSAASNTGDPVTDPLRIGSDPNFGSPHSYTGYIAEIILYDRVLNGTERGQLDAYIQAKYGL